MRSIGEVSTWWDLSEISAYLGITLEETRRLVVDGPLRGSWIGDRLMVHDSELARLRVNP